MKKTSVILVLLILILISIFAVYYNPLSRYFKNNKDNSNSPSVDNEYNIPDTNSENTTLQDIELENIEAESAGSNLGSNPNTDINSNETILPSDLYNASCGFYYESYGICTGTCPDGTCSSEGRSCYCKKN